MSGHIADQCYKMHGYPPGYRSKSAIAHQVSTFDDSANPIQQVLAHDVDANAMYQKGEPQTKSMESFVDTLGPDQYHHHMEMFSTHLDAHT